MSQERTGVDDSSMCLVKPKFILEDSTKPCYFTPWDLQMLSLDYVNLGLLFHKPEHIPIQTILENLKASLSNVLTHFFPLSGRLVTIRNLDLEPPHSYCVLLDCKDGKGVPFVHDVSQAKMSDILSHIYVPPIVDSLFVLGKAINHDGHTQPLLAVKITELVDGIFIGCSFNHAVGDGTSFWHFFNAWSEVARSKLPNEHIISLLPVTKRWFVNDHERVINLPYTHPDEFLERFKPDSFKVRMFHFTSQSIAHLKAKANQDLGTTNKISSFQVMCALVWRSITRARNLSDNQITKFRIIFDSRSRLEPKLPKGYFGNCVLGSHVVSLVGELLSNNLVWCADKFHKEISEFDNNKIRSFLERYTKAPSVTKIGQVQEGHTTVGIGGSPRFDMYTNDFGWGAPVAVCSGHCLIYDGKVDFYPGREGGGSMDLAICLAPESMVALESDIEFMDAVAPTI